MANDLFLRLVSARKRVIADRQIGIIHLLLEHGNLDIYEAYRRLRPVYNVKDPWHAFVRDVFSLDNLNAIDIDHTPLPTKNKAQQARIVLRIRLTWPTEVTETEFFQKTREMPKVKSLKYLAYDVPAPTLSKVA